MLTIGLTGCRYSGKTSIGKIFKQIGVPVFNADTVLKFIINFKINVEEPIRSNIGSHVYTDGQLDVTKFITDNSFDKLIDIVEFELFDAWNRFKEKNKKSSYIIFESSILFERGYQDKFDAVISVFAPKEDRVYRCKMNTGMLVEYVWDIFGKEMTDLEKNTNSNYVIHNYDSGPDVLNQVNSLDKKIIDHIINNQNLDGRIMDNQLTKLML
jgi:dephospho-CoA kinase